MRQLSVSSVGSSPLQHDEDHRHQPVPLTFSILGRIEPTATSQHRQPRSWRPRTFSILGRIEPTATGGPPLGARNPLGFQYPRSDRAHCNTPWRWRAALGSPLSVSSVGSSPLQLPESSPPSSLSSDLSVSSVGSSPLQRLHRLDCRSDLRPFSILGRIEPTATSIDHKTLLLRIGFQYPRSDRAHCNCAPPTRTRRQSRRLSVSSVGSSPLQPPSWSRSGWDAPGPFSILGRIEPTATGVWNDRGVDGDGGLSVSSVGSSPLQLLCLVPDARLLDLSVSSVGSSPLQQRHIPPRLVGPDHLFQYPRSDRAHCNDTWRRFSAMSRSPFQYPRSDRAHCNPAQGKGGREQR